MAVKRALVVDDSKSARAFLVRLLERLEVDVDVVESADEALDYLAIKRPDVIFLDHLMPGMDGFQGLQAIKRDPRMADVPVFMFTSHEGELYEGQALALGAAGVLPKQIEAADLARLLRELDGDIGAEPLPVKPSAAKPAPSARPPSAAAARRMPALPVDAMPPMPLMPPVPPLPPVPPMPFVPAAPPPAAVPAPSAALVADLAALRAEVGELRRFVATGLEAHSRQVIAEVAQVVGQAQPAAVETSLPPTRDWRGTLYALLATVAAIVLAVLWLRGEVDRRSLEMQVAQLAATREALSPESASASPAEAKTAAADAAQATVPGSPLVLPVAYGEQPLSGVRVERVQALLAQLASTGFQGTVDILVYPGRFCLKGSAAEGYALAPDSTPVARCEFVSAPGMEQAQRESPQFASMIGDFRKSHGEAIAVSVTNGTADALQRAYPETGLGNATAAEWNAAAAQNNRVEIRWRSRT